MKQNLRKKHQKNRDIIPQLHGYQSVAEIRREFKRASSALDAVHAKQKMWDQGQADYQLGERRKQEKIIETPKEKSIREKLSEKRQQIKNPEEASKKKKSRGMEL